MQNNIFILGAGDMAKVVYQIYKSCDKSDNVKGFLTNIKSEQGQVSEIYGKSIKIVDEIDGLDGEKLINGIGNPLRREFIKKLKKNGCKFDKIFHPSSIVAGDFETGYDVVGCANSVFSNGVRLGNHILIGANSYIGHDVLVNDFVTISPGVNIGGNTSIGEGSFLGIGSTIIQKVKVGKNVLIGAGSTVINDIPDDTLAFGNPAKPIRKITGKDWQGLFE